MVLICAKLSYFYCMASVRCQPQEIFHYFTFAHLPNGSFCFISMANISPESFLLSGMNCTIMSVHDDRIEHLYTSAVIGSHELKRDMECLQTR